MKSRLIITAIAICGLLVPASEAALNETADSVISKSVAAVGGAKSLRGVTDMVVRGSLKSGGVIGAFTAYSKVPNKYRVDVDFGSFKYSEGFDGRIAWQSNRGKIEQLGGAEAEFVKKEAYDSNDLLLRYKTRGITTELLGTRKVSGRDTLVVGWKYPDGTIKKIFVDSQSYLVLGEERFRPSKSGKKTLELSVYSDFRPINGLISPFKVIVINQFGKSELIIREIQNNTNLPLSTFQKPVK
jgi:hypothetical protein